MNNVRKRLAEALKPSCCRHSSTTVRTRIFLIYVGNDFTWDNDEPDMFEPE